MFIFGEKAAYSLFKGKTMVNFSLQKLCPV